MATARRSGSVMLRLTESEAAALIEICAKVKGTSHAEVIVMALYNAGVTWRAPGQFEGELHAVPNT